MAIENMSLLLEEIVEKSLLVEATDLSELAELHDCFEKVRTDAQGEDDEVIAQSSEAAISLIEAIILNEAEDAENSLALIRKTVQALQEGLQSSTPITLADFPSELGLSGEGSSSESPGEELVLPPYVDEEILSNILSAQPSNMELMESLILDLESDSSASAMDELKRLIHTLKGETGFLGLEIVCNLCHVLEEGLGASINSEVIETFLATKDWLAKLFDALSHGDMTLQSPETVLDQIAKLSETPSEKKETEAEPRIEPEVLPTPNTEVALEQSTQAPTNAQEVVVEGDLPEPFDPTQGDKDFLQGFVSEAKEHLENVDVHLLTLEDDPKNKEAIKAIFRGFHTIKGAADFVNTQQILELAREAENLLELARNRKVLLVGSAIDAIFDANDALKNMISGLAEALNSGSLLPPDPRVPSVIRTIHSAAVGSEQFTQPLPALDDIPEKRLGSILVDAGVIENEEVISSLGAQLAEEESKKLGEVMVENSMLSRKALDEALERQDQDPEKKKLGEQVADMGAASDTDIDEALSIQNKGPAKPKLGELLVRSGKAEAKDVVKALRDQKGADPSAVRVREAVKIDAQRLDMLVDAVGELVIAEAMVTQSAPAENGSGNHFTQHLMQLHKITRELQEIGMSMRMVPVKSTFQKMARLVRDLSKKSGKPVNFSMAGEDTELDKSVVDKIGDPLVHMIRNAVDHGLEASVEERRAA